MGIFDEVHQAMLADASSRQSREEQNAAARRQAATKISEELLAFIATHPLQQDVEVSLDNDVIVICRKSANIKLEISCRDREVFVVSNNGRASVPVSKATMARNVLSWLNG